MCLKSGAIRRPTRWCLAALLAAVMLSHAAPLQAQSLSENIAGLSDKTDQPIDIESDTLEVLDDEKRAVFRGNVKAVQGGMTLRSRELLVNYSGGEGLSGSNSRITNIRADGKVLITTEKNQTATSDWALFDVTAQLVTIGGNVVLSQGENVIKGDRLVIDLKTGRSRFENEGQVAAKKRVRGIFKPKQLEKPAQSDAGAGQ
jgi:lipopolysaccharide export system protein LptA